VDCSRDDPAHHSIVKRHSRDPKAGMKTGQIFGILA